MHPTSPQPASYYATCALAPKQTMSSNNEGTCSGLGTGSAGRSTSSATSTSTNNSSTDGSRRRDQHHVGSRHPDLISILNRAVAISHFDTQRESVAAAEDGRHTVVVNAETPDLCRSRLIATLGAVGRCRIPRPGAGNSSEDGDKDDSNDDERPRQ